MTNAATSPPATDREKKKRHFEDKHVDLGVKLTRGGMSEGSAEQYATLNCGVEGPEEQSEYRDAIDLVFARRGESLDALAWMMRRLTNREVLIEKMMRTINK